MSSFMASAIQSTTDRCEFGRTRRKLLRRVDQSDWKTPKNRPDPVDLLVKATQGRIAGLLPIRWARMAASPLGFFRGNVPLMAWDLAHTANTGITVQMCGDAHVRNLGVFCSPTGALVFDINDFDETYPGPWEWDVKRMAASLVLAGRESGNSDAICREAVLHFMADYRCSVDRCSKLTALQLARYTVHRHLHLGPIASVLRKAEHADPQHTLVKMAVRGRRGLWRFKSQKPLLQPVDKKTTTQVLAALQGYKTTLTPERRHFLSLYHPADIGFKVVGTGSVGTRDYVLLCFAAGAEDPLFLQMKEEPPSAYCPYVNNAAVPKNQGERVVQGQRLMQAQSDIFLGWTSMDGRDYIVRQLADYKASVDPLDLKGRGLCDYARMSGEVLGKGHARSGDACVLAGYCGNSDRLDKAIARFAFAYADQTEADYKLFMRAVKNGKLKIAKGVT